MYAWIEKKAPLTALFSMLLVEANATDSVL